MSKQFLPILLLRASIAIFCLAREDVRAVPNPSAMFCIEKGGNSMRSKHAYGGAYGICLFPDSKQCEEWAMMWGYCPVGGIDVTDLTSEERHCLIRGGILLDNATKCQLFTGKICNLKDYYLGKCDR